MWTASIVKKEIQGSRLHVVVDYLNGDDKKTETYNVSDVVTFKREVLEKLEQLNNAETLSAQLAIGEVDLTGVERATKRADKREQWFSDYRLMKSYTKAVELGLMAADDSAIVTLDASLKASFKPEYASGLNE